MSCMDTADECQTRASPPCLSGAYKSNRPSNQLTTQATTAPWIAFLLLCQFGEIWKKVKHNPSMIQPSTHVPKPDHLSTAAIHNVAQLSATDICMRRRRWWRRASLLFTISWSHKTPFDVCLVIKGTGYQFQTHSDFPPRTATQTTEADWSTTALNESEQRAYLDIHLWVFTSRMRRVCSNKKSVGVNI